MSGEAVRYFFVGLGAWVVDVIVFALVQAEIGVISAQAIARLSGAIVAFAGHKFYVFREHKTGLWHLSRQSLQYVLLWIFSYLVSTMGILWLMDSHDFPAVQAKIMVESMVIMLNFLIMKSYIFLKAR